MKIYGIFDRAIQAFAAMPFFQPTNAAAIRVMKDELNRQGSQLAAHPEDFELLHLGDFNEETGEIKPNKELVVRLQDLKETN